MDNFYEVYDTAEIGAYAAYDNFARRYNVVALGDGENPLDTASLPFRHCHCGQPLDDADCECGHCTAEWNEFLTEAADVRGNLTP
jgi:hypothetical protein